MRGRDLAIATGVGVGIYLVFRPRRASAAATLGPLSHIGRPLRGRIFVTSGWKDPRPHRNGTHRGIDIRAAIGTPVTSIAAGLVRRVDVDDDSGAGLHVVVNHVIPGFGNVLSRYLHMDKVATFKRGDEVQRGQVLGTSGKTGVKNSGPHLHFDMFACGPLALESYKRLFGTPVGEFPLDELRIDDCIPIPSEPFIPVDEYDDDVLEMARANRVPLRGAR